MCNSLVSICGRTQESAQEAVIELLTVQKRLCPIEPKCSPCKVLPLPHGPQPIDLRVQKVEHRIARRAEQIEQIRADERVCRRMHRELQQRPEAVDARLRHHRRDVLPGEVSRAHGLQEVALQAARVVKLSVRIVSALRL